MISELREYDYPDVSVESVTEINSMIREYNEYEVARRKVDREQQAIDDRGWKITKISFFIYTPLLFLIWAVLSNDTSFDALFGIFSWSIVLGGIASIITGNSLGQKGQKKPDTSWRNSSYRMDLVPERIARFKSDVEAMRLRNKITYWTSMSGHEFEKNIADLYRKRGYQVRVTRGSGDGGIDLYMEKNGVKYVVQCKNHKNQVGPAPVRDLFGAMTAERITHGIFIASGGYTTGARDFANGRIELLDIHDVLKMHQEYSM